MTDTPPMPRRGRPKGPARQTVATRVTPARALHAQQLQLAGHTREEIGRKMDCSIGTVANLLHLARTLQPDPTQPVPVSAVEETVTLPRTGKSPLQFRGRLRTTVSARHAVDTWTIRIFDVDGGHIVAIDYEKSHNRHPVSTHFAEFTTNPAQVLGNFEPLKTLAGYPPGERFADQQRALETQTLQAFGALISEALTSFPETFQPPEGTAVTVTLPAELYSLAARTHAPLEQWILDLIKSALSDARR